MYNCSQNTVEIFKILDVILTQSFFLFSEVPCYSVKTLQLFRRLVAFISVSSVLFFFNALLCDVCSVVK